MALADRPGRGAAGDPTGEQATAEEGALKRAIAMHAAAAETGNLAGGINIAERLPVVPEHARRQIGFEPAQRLARQDPKSNRDQRAAVGIEDAVRLGNPNQFVAEVVACAAQRGYLCILAKGVIDLAVAGAD